MKEKVRRRLAQALLVMAYVGIVLVYLLVLYGIASLIV